LQDSATVKSQVYVFRSKYWHLVDPREWDAKDFAQVGIDAFLAQYEGFN
jgi:hypothetical protein